ncbi:geraniol 8-hydroxylase-like protein [Tanacetum coccineum]
MDHTTLCLLISFILAFVYTTTIASRRNSRLPPGPYQLPIIGNLLQLGDKPHCSLAALSKHYGPLMSLKLGRITTIVVSSPDLAKEFFQTNDQSFASRSVPHTAHVIDHHKYSMLFLPVGDQWRRLRKISKEYLFSLKQLDASEGLRKKKVQELLDYVGECCTTKRSVNIGEVVSTTSLNVLSNFMFSKDFAQYDSASLQEFKDAVTNLLEIVGSPNLVDFFPMFKPFDPQGFVRKINVYGKKIMAYMDRIIDERSHLYHGATPTNNDVLDSLFNLEDEGEFTRNDMRHLFFDLFVGGGETTSSVIESAMVELIRNPKKMEAARSEIISYMQDKNRNIYESDISQLPLPTSCFIVPKDAQILCNIWAMGRDPKVWSDPETFLPERFLDVKIDYKGQDFELIPFGAGRRICPAVSMAHRITHIILGSLIHTFDWKLQGDMRVEDMDMTEKFGLTLSRNVPLIAIPTRL